MYKMVLITVEAYRDAKVHKIKIGNRKLFWVKMHDVQDGLGLKNISDLVRKEIQGIFETKNLTEKQKRKYIRNEQEITKKDSKSKYARSDITEKIIKSCRGVTQCNDKIHRAEKEETRENFRAILGLI